jgi:hypothetical protein
MNREVQITRVVTEEDRVGNVVAASACLEMRNIKQRERDGGQAGNDRMMQPWPGYAASGCQGAKRAVMKRLGSRKRNDEFEGRGRLLILAMI